MSSTPSKKGCQATVLLFGSAHDGFHDTVFELKTNYSISMITIDEPSGIPSSMQVSSAHIAVVASSMDTLEVNTDLVRKIKSISKSSFILCVPMKTTATFENPYLRMMLANAGAAMISADKVAIKRAFQQVLEQKPGPYCCVFCGLQLTEDSLWVHNPLYHVNERNRDSLACPICNINCDRHYDPYTVHLRNAHGPCARGEIVSEYSHNDEKLYAFSLVVCIRDLNGRKQMLLVQEFASSGFWLPGGRVDPGEGLQDAAIRECLEEAGCKIELTGILKIEYSPSKKESIRMRVIFLAKLQNEQENPKTLPDYESMGAVWVFFDDIEELYKRKLLRGSEPLIWARYLAKGGIVHDVNIIGREFLS